MTHRARLPKLLFMSHMKVTCEEGDGTLTVDTRSSSCMSCRVESY